MQLYKGYTKEQFSFLVNDTTLSSDDPLRYRKNLTKISKTKLSTILDRKTAVISDLSSGSLNKYEFSAGKDVLPEKGAAIKRFEYSPFGSELKKQTDIANNQQKFFKGQINVNNNSREDDAKIAKQKMMSKKKILVTKKKI